MYINNPGHMTKMGAVPIYGIKNLLRFQQNLACSIDGSTSMYT